GTGDDGLVVAVPRFGEPEVLYDSIELQILALAVGADGAVYAGGSPDGTVLRIVNGVATTYFDTPESYIWALEFGADGALYAATGDRGRIYRITAAGVGDIYYDSGEAHLLGMVRDGDGLVVGTSPSGLVLRVAGPDSARVLYDAAQDEIKALARVADGTLYAAAVGRQSRGDGDDRGQSGRNGQAGRGDWIDAQSNGHSGDGNGSRIYRIGADGAVAELWRPDADMVLALALDGDGGLWAATGSPGTLTHLDARGSATRLFETDASQVVALAQADGTLLMGTANPGRLVRVGPDVVSEGFLTSEVYDARNVAGWGRLRWQVTAPPGTAVRMQTRSGNTQTPDATWSAWSVQLRDPRGETIPSPPARFVQWRARLVGSHTLSPLLESVSLHYIEHNLPPRIHAIDVTSAAGPLTPLDADGPPDHVAQTLPSGVQVEFAYPRSLDRPVRLDQVSWLRGTRIASWVADDPNDDELRFDLYVKAEDEENWKLLDEDLEEQIYAFQTAEFDDGRYRIKVAVDDSPSNPPGEVLTDELAGQPFQVDNTPPELIGLRAQRQVDGSLLVTGEVVDATSIIVGIDYALDGGEWQGIFPLDGILDGYEETLRFTVDDVTPGEEHTVLVRVADQAGNVAARKAVVP
ncbi:MAG: hypothetical protein PVF43_10485, partial [Candidatus Eiseniibacteriota bacterium]